MLLEEVVRFLNGELELHVSGRAPERFVNLCWSRGVPLWGVRARPDGWCARVALRDVRRLRPLARAARVRVRFRRRRGLPFLARRALRHRVLALGVAGFLIGAFYASGFVWRVEVRGAERVPVAEIERTAAALGLRPGARRAAIEPDEVIAGIEAAFPAINQALLSFRGTRAVLTVIENAPVPALPPRVARDLVAREAGLVERMVVVQGAPAVREGDVVRAGQLLIAGVRLPEGRQATLPPGSAPPEGAWPIAAEGQVWARTWHDRYVEVPLRYVDRVRTGRRYVRHRIKGPAWEMIVWGRAPIPFADFEVEEGPRHSFSWRNRSPVVEIETQTYYELTGIERVRDAAGAVDFARSRAASEVLPTLPEGSQIRSIRATPVPLGGDRIGVRTRIEVLQDIAVPNDRR